LPAIIEVDSRLKGKYLGAPKGLGDKQLKTWSVEKGRYLLTLRDDTFSLQVLDCFKNKQDDLCDTVCQIEALMAYWGLPLTQGAIPPDQTDILSINGKIVSIKDVNATNKFIIDGNVINITKLEDNSSKNKPIKINIIDEQKPIITNKTLKFKIIDDHK
jgi:hypothetical protein